MHLLVVTGALVVGAVDFTIGFELRVDPLYLAPVALAAWTLGRHAGVAAAVLSAAASFSAGVLVGNGPAGTLANAWNTGAKLAAFLVVALLVSALRERADRERALARTDEPTGLPNVEAFRERALLEAERSRRWRRPLSLAYMDLVDLRVLDAEFGHAVRDEVLRTAAVSLRSALRSTDLAARVGAEEFALLLPETDRRGAGIVIERVVARMHEDMGRAGWPVHATFGPVTSIEPEDGEAPVRGSEGLLREVSRAGRRDAPAAAAASPAG